MTTQCVQQAARGWLHVLGTGIYDYQTLVSGVLAIGAALYAGMPVWRQLRDTNLQTQIQHRATLTAMLREGQDRFARVSKAISDPLSDLSQLTSDYDGEPTAIDAHDAHQMEQRVRGEIDWYLVGLKDTEEEAIEQAKIGLKAALDDLVETLNDVHWVAHNDQHDEDHSIPDDEWAELVRRSGEAELLAAEKVTAARKALRLLGEAQQAWGAGLRAQIARLDQAIAQSR